MVVGAIGVVLSLIMLMTRRRTDVVHHDTVDPAYREPLDRTDY